MGIRRGSFEKVATGEVWRPSSIVVNTPSIDVGAGLRAMAEAKKVQGEAEAQKYKTYADLSKQVFDMALNLGTSLYGISKAQGDAVDTALQEFSAEWNVQKENAKTGKTVNYDKLNVLQNNYNQAIANKNDIFNWSKSGRLSEPERTSVESTTSLFNSNTTLDEALPSLGK